MTQDRCHSIMQRALIILDGLYTYWDNILEPLNWPSHIKDNPLLFLLKIYFNKDINPDIDNIINYLELKTSEILLITSKIITKNTNNAYNEQLINSIDLSHFDNVSESQLQLITKTLRSFDEILQTTTTMLWNYNRAKIRHSEASQKLKAKLEAEQTTSATVSTALAINKALNNIENDNIRDKTTQIRISNIEKHLIQQNQTNREILNHLKIRKTPQRHLDNKLKTTSHQFREDIVDLTETGFNSPDNTSSPFRRKRKLNIQWDSTIQQVKQYNPETTPKQLFAPSITLTNAHTLANNPFSGHVVNTTQTSSIRGNPHNSNTNQPKTSFLGQTSPFNSQIDFLDQTTSAISNLQTQTPPNPFHNQQQNKKQKFRGGNHRGRKRGYLQRY